MTTATNLSRTSTDRNANQPAELRGNRAWARPAAVAGIAFVVFDVAAAFAPGAPPASDASAAKIATYFHEHAGGIKAQLLLGTIGIAALVWWFGALWRVMSHAEHERPRLAIIAAVSLVMGLTLVITATTFTSAAAIRPAGIDLTAMLYSLSFVASAAAGFGVGTFLIATCVLMHRTQFAPRWTSYLGFLAGAAFVVSGLGTATNSGAINSIGLIAFLTWCVWIIALSVYMWRGELVSRT